MARIRGNGIDIEYESFGRVSDPLILLIHGFAAQLIHWPESLCQGLAALDFRVVRFDNRDIGRSTHLSDRGMPDIPALMQAIASGRRPDVPYSLSDMASDAVSLLDALGVGQAHMVGASMGGMIAQLAAIDHPQRAKSLVSVMSTTGQPFPAPNPEALKVLFTPPKSSSREDLIETSIRVQHALASPGYPVAEAEIRRFAERVVDRAPYDPAGLARQSAALIAAQSRNALLKAVRCPALVLHGADDPVLPVVAAEDTAESIAGAELIIVPGMGHNFPESLVPVCVKHLGDFALKVEGRASAG